MDLSDYLVSKLDGVGAISTMDLFVAAQLAGVDCSMRDISKAMSGLGWTSYSKGGKRQWYRDDVRDKRMVALQALRGLLSSVDECTPTDIRQVIVSATGGVSDKVMEGILKYMHEGLGDWYADRETKKTKGYITFRRKRKE